MKVCNIYDILRITAESFFFLGGGTSLNMPLNNLDLKNMSLSMFVFVKNMLPGSKCLQCVKKKLSKCFQISSKCIENH